MSLLGFQIVDLNWLLFPIIQSIWPTCFERFNKFILLSVTAMLILRNNSSYLLFTKLSHNGFLVPVLYQGLLICISAILLLQQTLVWDLLVMSSKSCNTERNQLAIWRRNFKIFKISLVLLSATTTLLNWSLVWHWMVSFPSNIDLRMCFFLNNICTYKNKC